VPWHTHRPQRGPDRPSLPSRRSRAGIRSSALGSP